MAFLNPLGLLGLLTFPIILILHALRARSGRVVVSSLHLWQFLEPEKHGSQARGIPFSWLLILQLLIAALLSFALARPALTQATTQRVSRHLILVLDISTSMQAADIDPTRFDAARAEIPDLLTDLGPEDIATLIAFGDHPQILADTRATNLQSLLAALNTLVPGETGSDLAAGLALAAASHDPTIPAQVHIFTDSAYEMPDLTGFNLPAIWHTYGQSAANQAVLDLSVQSLSPTKHQVFARIANYDSTAADRVAAVLVDGTAVNTTQISVDPNASQAFTWEIVGSPQIITVQLEGEDLLPADDRAVISLPKSQVLRVALVAAQPAPLDRALGAIEGVEIVPILPDQYLPGSRFDLVVFRGTLPQRWPGGSVLVVDPPAGSGLLPILGRAQILGRPISVPDPLLVDVDWTGVRWGDTVTLAEIPEGFTSILSGEGQPLILRGQVGLTQVMVLLPDLQTGNLTRHPAFPVLVANAVRLAGGSPFPQVLSTGDALVVPSQEIYEQVRFSPPEGEPVTFSGQRPTFWDDTRLPGLYGVSVVDVLDGQTTDFSIGVNAGSPEESPIRPRFSADSATQPEIQTQEVETSISLVPYVLAAVIFLLVLEAWMSWRGSR